MSLLYVPHTGFQQVTLQDANGNSFGHLYLCNPGYQGSVEAPPPDPAAAIPNAPATVNSFEDVFLSLANAIGQYVSQMNDALVPLHLASIGGQTSFSGNSNDPNFNQDYENYCLAAAQLIRALGWISPVNPTNHPTRNYWPLVVFNPGESLSRSRDYVATSDLKNSEFPDPTPPPAGGQPDQKTVMYLNAWVPCDNNRKAVGWIDFHQDLEWDPANPSSDKAWSSWGFIKNFALTLYEPPATGLTAGISSSSSSSYYAASSSMPGR